MICFKKIFLLFSSLKITILCLFFLCIYIVWGTFYQVEYGIHAAQELFFDSWILLIKDFFPVPGVKSVLTLLSINLLCSGFRSFLFRLNKFGIFLMHAGTVILLLGSGISSFLVNKSSLSLAEGNRSSIAINFSKWEFNISLKNSLQNSATNETYKYELSDIKSGKQFNLKNGLSINIEKLYQNCSAYGSSLTSIDSLQSKPFSKKSHENIPGIILSVSKKEVPDFNISNIKLYGGAGIPTSFLLNSDTLSLSLQPWQANLPINIKLVKFLKENHPGTDEAKRYESRIHVNGPEIDREVVISMNKPFRYKTYTFYQTGYTKNNKGQYISTLSVVENPFWFVPYIAGFTVMSGLLFHFIIKFIYAYRKTRLKHE